MCRTVSEAVRDERKQRAPQRMGLRQSASRPTMILIDSAAELLMDEMQMPAEWKEGVVGGHLLDTGIFRLETFFYENAWRWCVVSGRDDVEAQCVADDREGAKSDAVGIDTRAADHRDAAASLARGARGLR